MCVVLSPSYTAEGRTKELKTAAAAPRSPAETDKYDRLVDKNDRGVDKKDRSFDKHDRGVDKNDRSFDKHDRGVDKNDRSFDKHDRGPEKRGPPLASTPVLRIVAVAGEFFFNRL